MKRANHAEAAPRPVPLWRAAARRGAAWDGRTPRGGDGLCPAAGAAQAAGSSASNSKLTMPRPVSDEGENLDGSEIASLASSQRFMDRTGYKVQFPPKKNLHEEFSGAVKDMFFAGENPLRQYKEQSSWSKRVWLGLQYVFPVLDWGRHYNIGKFKGDLIAGLTLASLCIPQMNEIDPKKNPLEYKRLAFTATFFAGITQAALGIFRLGFIIEFLSHAGIVGFMAGAAIIITLQQLKGFLGIKNFTTSTDIVSVMKSIRKSAHHGWNWQTILIGASFLGFLLVAKYIGKKKKKLFWISAIAPLISVIISTFFVYITRADKQGVAIVKSIKKGINPPSASLIYFTGPLVLKGFKIGVVAGLIALTESIAIGRTFAAMHGYQLDGNKEMVALGAMNVVGSLTSCYITTGGFARSAVNCMAGGKTAASNIVMSTVVLLALLFFTPLFKYTPNAILSSIVITAVIGLIDYKSAYLIWNVDKLDFLACLGAFFGVIFYSVEYGLLIAVAISIAKILLRATRPKTTLLGNLPKTSIYRNTEQYPEVITVPGVVIVSVDSAIYFTNSNYVTDRILSSLREEEERQHPRIEFLIIELSPVVDIDTSGIHALEELFRTLEKRQIQLILVNPGPAVIQKLRSARLPELIGEDKIYLTVADAVKKCAPKAIDSV
ncbi:hypothetical protein ACP4OV_008672 [Aristida adscensionis]